MCRLFSSLIIGMLMALSASAQTLTIVCENNPPAQFVDANGKLAGYAVELVQEIQKRVGNKDEIKLLPWSRGYDMIRNGSNVVLFQMARSAERNELFHWVGPIQETVYGFYARADSPLTLSSLEEAKKLRRIGVYREDIRFQILTQAGFTNLVVANDNEVNVVQLMRGRIDLYAAATDTYRADATRAGINPSDLKLVFPFHKAQVYIAMSKKMPPQVVERWSAALAAMREDGSMEKLLKKYYPGKSLPGPEIREF